MGRFSSSPQLIIQPFLMEFAKTKLKNQKSYLNLEDVYPFSAILRIRNVHFFLLLEQATEISEGEKESGIENLFHSNYRGPDVNKKAPLQLQSPQLRFRFRFLILQSRGRFTPKLPSKNTSRWGEKMEKGKQKKQKKSMEPKHRLPRGK